jgi:signal peptidase I
MKVIIHKGRVTERVRDIINKWAVPFGCGLLLALLLRYIFFVGYVPTASMEPAIKQESFVFGIRIINELKLGDVVIFERNGRLLVKRIAALPGDTVVISGKSMIIPDNYYFMLGDNAEMSFDSRYWNEPFVSEWQIKAKVCSAR